MKENKMKKITDRIPLEITIDVLPDPTITMRDMNLWGYKRQDVLPCHGDIATALDKEGCEVFDITYGNGRKYPFPSDPDYYDGYPDCGVNRDDWHGILRKYSMRDIKRMFWSHTAGVDYCDIPFDAMIKILPEKNAKECRARLENDFCSFIIISKQTANKLKEKTSVPVFARNWEWDSVKEYDEFVKDKNENPDFFDEVPYRPDEDPSLEYLIKNEDWELFVYQHSIESIYHLLWETDESK